MHHIRQAFRPAPPRPRGTASAAMALRLHEGLADAGLDCGCRETADRLIDRIAAEDEGARRASGLADARRMRDAIVLVLALLAELDDLSPDEADRTAFAEVADLFRDIGDFAAFGIEAIGRAAGGTAG